MIFSRRSVRRSGLPPVAESGRCQWRLERTTERTETCCAANAKDFLQRKESICQYYQSGFLKHWKHLQNKCWANDIKIMCWLWLRPSCQPADWHFLFRNKKIQSRRFFGRKQNGSWSFSKLSPWDLCWNLLLGKNAKSRQMSWNIYGWAEIQSIRQWSRGEMDGEA